MHKEDSVIHFLQNDSGYIWGIEFWVSSSTLIRVTFEGNAVCVWQADFSERAVRFVLIDAISSWRLTDLSVPLKA